jgi:hypothetical protein
LKIEHVPVDAIRAQHKSFEPVARTFGALMLAYADGDVVPDAAATAQRYKVRLRSVAEYASGIVGQKVVTLQG